MLGRCVVTLVCMVLYAGIAWCAVPVQLDSEKYPAVGTGCLAGNCHIDHEPVRSHDSEMAKQIYLLGEDQGDPNGCVVCHGGDPAAMWENRVHEGAPPESLLTEFTATPAAAPVVERTCGQCHAKRVYSLQRSGMATGAGHMSAILQGWGIKPESPVGVYTVTDVDGILPPTGTPEYQLYMRTLQKQQQAVFTERITALPLYHDWKRIEATPQLAAYRYTRSECAGCHVWNVNSGGKGSGCAACHVRYTEDGIQRSHTLQGTARSTLVVEGKTVSGIAIDNCAKCHAKGKHIALSYSGKMRISGTQKLRAMRDDVHHNGMNRFGNPSGGLLCQDCHSTRAMHGTGNISVSGRVNVEIECADCHGTTEKFPWELPTGWQDEFAVPVVSGEKRGTTSLLPASQKEGYVYRPEDGYLLSTRGNPFGNVVRRGNAVVVHSATGISYAVPLLKTMAQRQTWKNPHRAVSAMVQNPKHMASLECYSCHSGWVPQEYGNHILGTFSSVDKLVATRKTEFVQWRNPVLGVNGEGRVSPLTPLMQQDVTLLAPDEAVILRRHIFPSYRVQGNPQTIYNVLHKTIEDLWVNRVDTDREETALSVYSSAGSYAEQTAPLENLLAASFVVAPLAPHTVTRNARTCESCHASSKALGYGDDAGYGIAHAPLRSSWLQAALSRGGATEILAQGKSKQMQSRRGSNFSAAKVPYVQLLTRTGRQLQQVGFHWRLSAPLSEQQRKRMEQQNPFVSIRNGTNVTEGSVMVIGKYEIDAIAASAAILAIIFFVIVAAFVHTRRCKRKNDPKC
ncbi:multiheme c-type cytochrome [Halodesulfovibrio spirochaetisodalis]|uniref:multiheme c-type cytochrome n=1 Tax=Halodesulfovibrio spirochaetisodalis TaxID=1560234 RepID=UPI0008300727|nr:multiheme c-type cytochrome [Halodesulfovibrio spirochaetisodalis]